MQETKVDYEVIHFCFVEPLFCSVQPCMTNFWLQNPATEVKGYVHIVLEKSFQDGSVISWPKMALIMK